MVMARTSGRSAAPLAAKSATRPTVAAGVAADAPPTVVQAVAWEIKGGVKGSLSALSRASGITLDALRVAKRTPGTKGARPLSPSRARLLSLIAAAHRRGILAQLLREAAAIEDEWRRRYPDGVVD